MDKWAAIFLMVLVTAMFSPMLVDTYQSKQCRIEAIKAGVEVDKINSVCGAK